MSIFDKHIGGDHTIEIEGDTFTLKPLTTKQLPNFFKAMKAFSGAKEGASIEDVLKNIDDAGLNAVQLLIEDTLTKSYPNEDKEKLSQFGLKYMSVLIGKIFEINSAKFEK